MFCVFVKCLETLLSSYVCRHICVCLCVICMPSRMMPDVFYLSDSPASLWRFAFNVVLSRVTEHARRQTWAFVASRAQLNVRYVRAYTRKLTDPVLDADMSVSCHLCVSAASLCVPMSGASLCVPMCGASLCVPMCGASLCVPMYGASLCVPMCGASLCVLICGASLCVSMCGASLCVPMCGASLCVPMCGASLCVPMCGASLCVPMCGASLCVPMCGASLCVLMCGEHLLACLFCSVCFNLSYLVWEGGGCSFTPMWEGGGC